MAITVEGDKVTIDTLLRLSPAIHERVKGAVAEATQHVKEAAIANAPERTGELKSKIESEISSGGMFGRVRAKAPHSHLVEFGTVHMSAHPFLFPAHEAERGRFVEAVKNAVEGGISDAV